MNKTLFNIKDDAIKLYQQIEDADGVLTPELETLLAISESELKTKSTGYVGLIKTLDAEVLIMKEEIKRINGLIKRNDNITSHLKYNLSDAMITFEVEEIVTELVKINFRKSKSVVIDDIDLLPDHLKTTTISIVPNKKAIKEAIEENTVTIKGAHISENKNLQIK